MVLTGITRNGVVVFDDGQSLPDGVKVKVITDNGERKPTLAERLLRHAGTVPDLPADMAEQHDHYAHGAPKR